MLTEPWSGPTEAKPKLSLTHALSLDVTLGSLLSAMAGVECTWLMLNK